MNTDTIRTVISIVPDWTLTGNDLSIHRPTSGIMYNEYGFDFDTIGQFELDALAAAAVRVVNSKRNPRYMVYSYPEAVEIVLDGCIGDDYVVKVDGPNETENRLEAIAEFVNGGGFDG